MNIKQYFSCPKCQRPCRWDPDLAGRRVLCRRCRQKIRVPQQLTADVEIHLTSQQTANDSWTDDEESPGIPTSDDAGAYHFMEPSSPPAAPAPNAAETPAPPPLFPMPSSPDPAQDYPPYPLPGNGYAGPPASMPGPAPAGPLPPPPSYYPSNSGPPYYGPPVYPPPYSSPVGGYGPPPSPYPYAPAATSPSYGYPPPAQTAPAAPVSQQPRSIAAQRSARNSGGSSSMIAAIVVMGLLGTVSALVLAYQVILPFQQEQARLKALEASLQAPDFDFNAVEPTNSSDQQPREPSISAFPELSARYPADWPELFQRKTAAMENGLTGAIRQSILDLPAHIAESKRVQGRWSKGDVAANWTINGYDVDMTLLGPDKKLGTQDDYKFRFTVAANKQK